PSHPHPPPHKKKRERKETWYRDSQLSDFKQRVCLPSALHFSPVHLTTESPAEPEPVVPPNR
ncbi:unnamed protein product, partial [Rangifer tarandus platyrhynchus]